MKRLFFSIFILTISFQSFSQNEINDLIKLSQLLNKKDSIVAAYSYYPCKLLSKKIRKIDCEIQKIEKKSSVTGIREELSKSILIAKKASSDLNYSNVVTSLSFLENDIYIPILKDTIVSLYFELANAYLKLNNYDSATIFLEKYLTFGGKDVTPVIEISSRPAFSEKHGSMFFDIWLQSYIRSHETSNLYYDLLLELVVINDQFTRSYSYQENTDFSLEYVYKSDSINQLILEQLFENKCFYDTSALFFSKAFSLVLLHSIYSNRSFFEKHFSLLAKKCAFQFEKYTSLQYFFDMYLKRVRNSQWFGTVKGIREDGSFGDLPIENADTVNRIMRDLNIQYNK